MQSSSDPFQLTRFFDKLRTALSYQKRVKAQGDELAILIACSGGIDSLALLYLMSELKDELGLKLGACYVDHKARPESGDEAKFVDKICQELQVPFFYGEFSDNFWAETKKNFEERAREERYRILEMTAIDNNYSCIATAHHRDDQVETILMRILERGSGLKGLCGIKPVVTHPTNPLLTFPPTTFLKERGVSSPSPSGEGFRVRLSPSITIIRPLLDIPKSDIVDYMAGRQYLSDQTNNDTIYRRNHYRKVVIPLLKEMLPDINIEKHICQLAQNAQRERAVMEEFMREFWQLSTHPGFQPPLSSPKRGDGGELHIPRTLIESKSDDFWLTAFSYLFSFGDLTPDPSPEGKGRKYSHSNQTLIDIVAFIRKTDPGTASYNPYILERNREGVQLTPAPLFAEKRG